MRLRLVRAHVGVSWVQQGVRVFWRQPLALAGLFFLTMAVMSVLTLVPLLGPALALAVLPTASLVMMVAAVQVQQGQ